MAAAYLFHITKNHPFVDGNQRAGLAVALAFLKLNGYTLSAENTEVERAVLAIASGQMDKPQATDWVRGS